MKSKLGQVAMATVMSCALSAPAAATTWNFTEHGSGDLDNDSGPLAFTTGGQTITVSGYDTPSKTDELWKKTDGFGETGLGLEGSPQHEIGPGEFISLLMPTAFSRTYTLTLGSLQGPPQSKPAERATIYECTTATGPVCKKLTTVKGGGPVEKSVTLTLDSGFSYFKIKDKDAGGGENVLLKSVTSVVPLPAAAWLLLSGLGGLVMFGRRKRAS